MGHSLGLTDVVHRRVVQSIGGVEANRGNGGIFDRRFDKLLDTLPPRGEVHHTDSQVFSTRFEHSHNRVREVGTERCLADSLLAKEEDAIRQQVLGRFVQVIGTGKNERTGLSFSH